jgi:hypothetical protein
MSVPLDILEKGMNLNPIQDAIKDVYNDLELIALKLKAKIDLEDPDETKRQEDLYDEQAIIGYQLCGDPCCDEKFYHQISKITDMLAILYTVRHPVCMDCKHKTLGLCDGLECGELDFEPIESPFIVIAPTSLQGQTT